MPYGYGASQDYYEKAKKEYKKKDDHHPGQGSNTYKKKDTTPKEVKTGNARDDWRANQGLRNIQDQQAKKAAADAARADIIKRSQTGNVDREDYRGGRHKYGMDQDEYVQMMQSIPKNKYADMFPKSAGIPKLFSALGNLIPGVGIGSAILNSIKGSDAGTMAKDLSNPFINLFKNIFGKKTKATNPEAVSLVDNDWEKISGNTLDNVFDQNKLAMWPDLIAETTEDELAPLVSRGTGRGDLSPGFDYETDRQNREQSAKRAFLEQVNPGIDYDKVHPGLIDEFYEKELAKQQGTDLIAPKADEIWEEGIGSLTEPTPYPETDENVHRNWWSEGYTLPLQQDPGFDEEYEEIRDTLPEEEITDTVVEDQIPLERATAVTPTLQQKQDMWNYGLGQMLSRQHPYFGKDPYLEGDTRPHHANTLRELLDDMNETERSYVPYGQIGKYAAENLLENLSGYNLQTSDWDQDAYAEYLDSLDKYGGAPFSDKRYNEMLRQLLPKYPRKEGFFEKLPFYSGPLDFNFQSEKQIPWKYKDLFSRDTPDYNKGGIASLRLGGDPGYEPGMFTPGTTITDEETYDIQPLQMDPGIMGIGDLEDLFEEAKVKESIYDKLKYVNNTMHG